MGPAQPALVAFKTGHCRIDGDHLSRLHPGDAGTGLYNSAGTLMSKDEWISHDL
jgi:hypothetical protein